MRRLAFAVLLFAPLAPIRGQATLRIAAGALASSDLAHDDFLDTSVRPKLAPEVSLAVTAPTGRGGFRVLLEGSWARASLAIDDPEGTGSLAPVSTITGLLLAEGPIAAGVRWQLGGGAVFYRPSQRQGIFQDGTTQRWLVAGGVTWSRPIAAGTALTVTGRIDTEEFITSTMRRYGYTAQQNLRRGALLLGVEHTL